MHRAAGLFSLVVLVGGCSSSPTADVEQTLSEPSPEATATTTAQPTPAEVLVDCLAGSEDDDVLCAGARVVVSDENDQVSAALSALDACELDCGVATELAIRAASGEDITDELGPGPEEVWAPDLDLVQGTVDLLNQANDAAGAYGFRMVYISLGHDGTVADPWACLGAAVDGTGVTVANMDQFTQEALADLESARRTDEWTVPDGINDPPQQLQPSGRIYAYPLTTTDESPTYVGGTQTAEIHVAVTDGDARLFPVCRVGYQVRNPNDTDAVVQEVISRLTSAGIWDSSWPTFGRTQ